MVTAENSNSIPSEEELCPPKIDELRLSQFVDLKEEAEELKNWMTNYVQVLRLAAGELDHEPRADSNLANIHSVLSQAAQLSTSLSPLIKGALEGSKNESSPALLLSLSEIFVRYAQASYLIAMQETSLAGKPTTQNDVKKYCELLRKALKAFESSPIDARKRGVVMGYIQNELAAHD